MQLVAYGAQDIYLTGQPQITFFKSVYRRHTNFSVESILQTINGASNPGSRVSVTISRNGDLLKNLWVQYNPNSFVTAASGSVVPACDFGHALFEQLEIEIGGQLIDRQFGKWLTIWRDLCETNPTGAQGELQVAGAEPGVNVDAGGNPSTRYQRMAYTHQGGGVTALTSAPTEAYVPMKFWFCRNPGLAIPLIALQYHEVKFNITYQTLNKLVDTTGATGVSTLGYSTINVYADYVYLDTTERRQFAQNAHEYLIDQLQVQNDNVNGGTIRLNFNHPVKELIWTGAPLPPTPSSSSVEDVQGGATPSAIILGANSLASTTVKSKIVLNGTDRFTERNLKYFTRNQVWDCHTGFGATAVPDAIALYSFALRPEEHQPSGTCNFSRIDTAQLVFTNISGVTFNPLDIYAVNYNVLRIMSGMGGLAYSN
jgi:Major capsid protein N-terminus/Large eukaryotic DNA virus major capsid protein